MKAAHQFARRICQEDSGQTLILVALTMTILMGFLALSVDMGLLFCTKRSAQSAADAAAIAAAQELPYGDAVAAAQADAALNGYTNGVNGVTVAVNNPPLHGPNTGNATYSEVIVTVPKSTFFLNAFKKSSMTVQARAVATLGTNQNCMYALSTSGTDLNLSNGVSINLPNCAVYGNSTSTSDLSVIGGASLKAGAVNLVGNYTTNNGGTISVTPNVGISPVSDPLAYLPTPSFTPSSCLANPNLGSGSSSVGPATSGGTICYNGLTIANGATATLKPGFYIINGSFSIAGGATATGTGVTFYFPPGGSISISNGINFSLTAPTTGTYNGILFYQNRTNSTAAYVEGGATSVLNGILYFPDANLTLENGTSTTTYAAVIASTLTFAGGTQFQNYSLSNANSPLNSARIVE